MKNQSMCLAICGVFVVFFCFGCGDDIPANAVVEANADAGNGDSSIRFDDVSADAGISADAPTYAFDAVDAMEVSTNGHIKSWGVKAVVAKSKDAGLVTNVYMEFIYTMDSGQLNLKDAEGANKPQSNGEEVVAFYDDMGLLCKTYDIGYTVVFRGLYFDGITGKSVADVTDQVSASVVYFVDHKQVSEVPLQLVKVAPGMVVKWPTLILKSDTVAPELEKLCKAGY